MFNEVKSMMRISGDDDDDAIILNIKAAALDLTRTADIVLPGSIDISRDAVTGEITDNSTVTDELIILTIATWCIARIGNPPNYDKLMAAYEMMKGSLRLSSDYTNYPEDAEEPEDEDEPEAGADEDPGETDPPAGE